MKLSRLCQGQLDWCNDALGRLRARLDEAELRELVEILETLIEVSRALADAVEEMEGAHR